MILIFRHVDCEGPGYLAEVLEREGYPYRLVQIDAGDSVPSDIEGVSGLVFMGGPMSVNDDLPWIQEEIDLIRKADARDIPVLGHCLGGQLMAKALDAVVTENDVTEIGWFPVNKPGDALGISWLRELPSEFMVFHWHGETFSMPLGATRILANRHCTNQGFVVRNHIALQCHVEMTAEMVEEWCKRFGPELKPSRSVQATEEMLHDLDTRISELKTVADVIYLHWLKSVSKQV
ncbi:MAG: type 1 glutamine amidotransferase [Gammaproteobacteria bacterium]|nr:type 1 glutamine amidotransferase [Gammaproteobacteria bacterium]